MFDINYIGGNGVEISTKTTNIYIDPKVSIIGLKDPKVGKNVELATEERFRLDSPDAKIVIEGPGEYEVGDYMIKGTAVNRHIDEPGSVKRSTAYHIDISDVRIGVIGNIDPKLDESQLEGIGIVDILILPVGGGGYTLDATSAAAIVRQVDPKVVIPVHYADSSIRYEVPQDSLDLFISETGAPVETMQKYKVKSSASIPQTLTIVKLER